MDSQASAAIIDSHCHLDFDAYGEDRPAVLARARAAGLVTMICIGSGRDIASARSAVALAGTEPDIFATVGIHPHDVAHMTETDWDELGALATAPRVVGIGETGLDYHYDHSPRPEQRDAFRRFLRLCHTSAQPVVCHIRDAHEDARTIMQEEGVPARGGVIHCFTGTPADAEAYLAMGLHISYSGIITFKTAADIRAAAALTPLDRVLVETDAPYLAPIPHRGKRNEPSFIRETVAAVAQSQGLDFVAIAEASTRNARTLFRLPAALPSPG